MIAPGSDTKPWLTQRFEGGWSTDLKIGIANSQAFTQSLDFRKNPSQLSLLPQPRREDGGILKDLIVNEVMANDGTIYGVGNLGYLYKRTTGGAWSLVNKLTSNSGYGMDYRFDTDSIYITGQKTVSSYNPVSGAPVLLKDTYGISQSTYNNTANAGFNVNVNQSGSSQTCAIQTTFNETAAQRRFLQSDIEPLNKLDVYIVSKGTGDWTLTLHDGLNNVLGTSTVTNANLTNNAFNDFVFTSATNGQVRIYVSPNARTYHFHLTSTVADGLIQSSTANNLGTCDMQLWADRLVVTNNGLHPMGRFLQYEVIGNGNYLSVWEPLTEPPTNSEWLRHKLVFPMQYEVCGVTFTNEFTVVAVERKTTNSTSIAQSGMLFFWDGLSGTYNYNVPIPEGAPHCINTYENIVYYYADGAWWYITSPTTTPIKIRTMPGSDTEFSGAAAPINIYPNCAAVRRGIHLMAYPSSTTNTSINYGVYSWGAIDQNYPKSFGYNYVISTKSQNYSGSNNLTIGMVKNFGDTLHIAWRDDLNGGYGIDVVDNTSNPSAFATWNSVIFDNGYVAKRKTANFMEVYYPSLPPGSTITLKYKIDRNANWTSSQAYSSTILWNGKPGYARFNINNTDSNGGRFYEIQLGVDINCDSTVTTTPILGAVNLIFQTNAGESLR